MVRWTRLGVGVLAVAGLVGGAQESTGDDGAPAGEDKVASYVGPLNQDAVVSAERTLELGQIVWPEAEHWKLLVPGTKGEKGPDDALRRDVTDIIAAFCTEQRFSNEACDVIKELALVQSEEVPAGKSVFAGFNISTYVQVIVNLAVDSVSSNITARLPLNTEPEPLIEAACEQHNVKRESCDAIVTSAQEEWQSKRDLVVSNVQKHYQTALAALFRLEQGGNSTWEDVVRTYYGAEMVQRFDPLNWRACMITGILYFRATSNPEIASSLGVNETREALLFSANAFEKSLALHLELKHNDTTVQNLSAERAYILYAVGHTAFLLGSSPEWLARARETLNAGLSVAIQAELPTETEQDASKEVMRLARMLYAELLRFEVNAGTSEQVRLLAHLDLARYLLSPMEIFNVKLMAAMHVPIVHPSPAATQDTARVAFTDVERLLATLRTDRAAREHNELLLMGPRQSWLAGSPLGPEAHRTFRANLQALHRLATPSLSQMFSSHLVRCGARPDLEDCPAQQLEGAPVTRVGVVSVGFTSDVMSSHSACQTVLALSQDPQLNVTAIQLGDLTSPPQGSCAEMWASIEAEKRLVSNATSVSKSQVEDLFVDLAALQLDVLIFLEPSSSTIQFLLSFGRAAPVQLAFESEPITNGHHDLVDFTVIPQVMLPEGVFRGNASGIPVCSSELHLTKETSMLIPFTEQVLCPGSLGRVFVDPVKGTNESEQQEAAKKVREYLGEFKSEEAVLISIAGPLTHIHPEMDETIAAVAQWLPHAVVVLERPHENSLGFSVFTQLEDSLVERFSTAAPGLQILWVPPLGVLQRRELWRQSAAVLESFGAVPSLRLAFEMVAAGAPVVSLASFHATTGSVSGLLRHLAVEMQEDWIATELSCVHKACVAETVVRLARDPSLRERWTQVLTSDRAAAVWYSSAATARVSHEWANLLHSLTAGPGAAYTYGPKSRDVVPLKVLQPLALSRSPGADASVTRGASTPFVRLQELPLRL
eukprot:CAMPEP_0184541192 /NCGR_PEP_ID=MMETSP0199_2-20130426/1241_1 /TAXON_ID=1112570 /ORGANISM="Thraustochytrium sp., Strain LLF1b" /LENGTH=996 /DNA_ID=CAMNT_0026934903 /DNA_START=52 /DNA_END=3042 /DNA_ORIENTATION=-